MHGEGKKAMGSRLATLERKAAKLVHFEVSFRLVKGLSALAPAQRAGAQRLCAMASRRTQKYGATAGSPSLLKYSMFEIENCYSVPLLAKERGPDLPPEPPSPKEVGANLQPIVAFW